MTTSALNSKIGEIENTIPNVSGLVKKDYAAKILDLEGKYFTTAIINLWVTYLMQR